LEDDAMFWWGHFLPFWRNWQSPSSNKLTKLIPSHCLVTLPWKWRQLGSPTHRKISPTTIWCHIPRMVTTHI
jgi:hypothetical protein